MTPNPIRSWPGAAVRGLAGLTLIPRVAWLSAKAPRDAHHGWDGFWAGVRETGNGGDVLWDSSDDNEARGYLPILREKFDPDLPIVDIGCGNGRFTRLLAPEFMRAVGVDVSPHAIERARAETGAVENVEFDVLDVAAPGAGAELRERFGEANVFVRGLFHVLDQQARSAVAENLRKLVGNRGRVLLAETDYRGSTLNYLHHLGATLRRIPPPLENAVVWLPKPGHFGSAERRLVFPDHRWRLISDGATTIEAVPMRTNDAAERIPGYFAVLERTTG